MTLVGMSRPPVQKVVATRRSHSLLTVARTAATKLRSTSFAAIAAVPVLVFASLGLLTGCQGVSAGSNQQTSTLSLNTAALQFGSVPAGSSKSLTVTATNSGPAAVNVSSVSISSKYFSLVSPTIPMSVAAGQSVPVVVSFTPNAAGAFTATATVSSDASDSSTTLSLSGTGSAGSQGDLGSSPSSEAFGSVTIGAQQSQTFTLTNSGSASVAVSQISITGAGFQLSGITAPLTLAGSQSTTFKVAFVPQAAGAVSGSVTITSDASNSPLTVGLSGTGVTPGFLTSNPTSLSFGTVTVGSNSSLLETVTNTGGTSVSISQIGVSGAGFSLSGATTPVTLGAGQSTTFHVSFAPSSAGSASGSVTVTSDASNSPLSIALSGTGASPGALTSNPTSLSFGSVTVGSNSSLLETLTNTGGTSVTISRIAITGTGFTLSGAATPVTLGGGQSTSFHVVFTPAATGSASGTVTVTSNASNPTLNVTLSGTGTATAGQLAVSPLTLALGSVVVGSSGSASGSLTASGASVTVSAGSTNNGVFTLSGLTLPHTISAGNSVPFTVTFRPTTTGAVSATLTFTSNAQNSPTAETLTGTGSPAPTYDVALSWNASTSSSISGYNVYRAVYSNSACGSFAKINPSLNASTDYTDSVVVNGTSYCYAATAVDSGNQESAYSNVVSNVQIP